MSRGLLRDDVTDAEGNAVQGAQVTVYIAGTLTKATLYSESVGGVILANPLTTDEKGVFQAFVDTAEYDISVVTAAGTENVSNVPVLDADDVASIESNLATSQQQIDDLTAISKAFVRTPEQTLSAQTVVAVPEISDQTADITSVFVNGSAIRSGYSVSAGQVTFNDPVSGDFWALVPFTNPIGTTTAGAVTDTSRGQSVQSTLGETSLSDITSIIGKVGAFDGQRVSIASYHPGWAAVASNPVGGGEFVWQASRDKSDHNGGTVISPTVPWNGLQANLSDFLDGVGETDGAGQGCWVRQSDDRVITYWGARESFDCYAPIQAAIDSCPDETVNFEGVGVATFIGAEEVRFPTNNTGQVYESSQKIVIAPEKNVRLVCDAPKSATVKYTGLSTMAIEFQPHSGTASFGVENLHVMYGGIAVIGGSSGSINFDRPFITAAPAEGMWFVDAADYTDGVNGDYPSGGYTGPNPTAGINTVYVNLNRPRFDYCENGLRISSSTILLFNCFKPVFNSTTDVALEIDSIHVTVDSPEFQGIRNWETGAFVKLPVSGLAVSYVALNNPRFGSEEYSPDGVVFKPPKNTIIVGELGAHVPGDGVVDLRIDRALAFGNDGPTDTENFIFANRRLINCRITNSRFRNYTDSIIQQAHFDATAEADLDCVWQDNEIEGSVNQLFSSTTDGWQDRDSRTYGKGGIPTVAAGPAVGDGSVSVIGNDTSGRITINAGTGRAGTLIANIDFSSQFTTSTNPVITPANPDAANLTGLYVTGADRTGFDLRGTLADSTTYIYTYAVLDRP